MVTLLSRWSLDRGVHRHEAAAVGEHRLDLHHGNEVGDAVHDVGLGERRARLLRHLLDRLAGARAVEGGGGDDRDGFRVVELDPLCLALQRHLGQHVDEELVELPGCELHSFPLLEPPAGGPLYRGDFARSRFRARPVSSMKRGVNRCDVVALRQERLKLLVAYSTVAQIGYLFLMFPLAFDAGAAALERGGALAGGMLQAISHATAKAAMFMAAGLIYKT